MGQGDSPPHGWVGGVGEALGFCCRVAATDGSSPQLGRRKLNAQGHAVIAQIYARTTVKRGNKQPKRRYRVPRTISLSHPVKQLHLRTSATQSLFVNLHRVLIHVQVQSRFLVYTEIACPWARHACVYVHTRTLSWEDAE